MMSVRHVRMGVRLWSMIVCMRMSRALRQRFTVRVIVVIILCAMHVAVRV